MNDIILSLARALYDQMVWTYIEHQQHEKPKGPPYTVPSSIQGDLVLLVTVQEKSDAYRTLKQAVASAAGRRLEDLYDP